jgi:hypothetical protein
MLWIAWALELLQAFCERMLQLRKFIELACLNLMSQTSFMI